MPNSASIRCSLIALGVFITTACGGGPPPAPPPVQQQGPEDEILAIGNAWEARSQSSGLKSEPSKISVFSLLELSRIEFTAGEVLAKETLTIEETFRMRDGRSFKCTSGGTLQVQVRFFRKIEEPAVQIARPPLQLARQCDQPGFPEPVLTIGEQRSSFLLRAERLNGFDPPLEKRAYIPVQ
jgi:hypothetical protein